MTEEALQQANRIKSDLERVTQAKRDIMTYTNERLELDVTVKKGLMHFVADEETTRHYTLWTDSPLFIAIAGALEDMREELQDQLDNLDSNLKQKPLMQRDYGDTHPIGKTSWWDKAFRWIKPKK